MYRMTASDLFIFMKQKEEGKKRNPAWVGWENTKFYVNPGFMRGKSRSNLGPAKWPLSISVNHSLTQSGRHWQPLDISVLSSRGVPAASLRPVPYCRAERSYTFGRWGTKQPLSLLVFLHLFFCRFFLHLQDGLPALPD